MTSAALFMVSLVVTKMDEAIAHFTEAWGFELLCDSHHAAGHRWVEIAPDGGARLRLIEASTDEQRNIVGMQAGGSVAFFLKVTGFDAALSRWVANGIEIAEPERVESYGRLVVMRDKLGNRWDVFDAEVTA